MPRERTGGHWDPVTRTSGKCLICKSRYQAEIEKQLSEGKKTQVEIIAWVKKQKPSEIISRHSLKRHKKNHNYKVLSIQTGKNKKIEVKEHQLKSLTEFLDLIIEKVDKGVTSGNLKPTVTEGVKAAEIKGKIKEDSKWEQELIKFFMGVSQQRGFSN